MNKAEIVAALADTVELTKKEAELCYDTIFNLIIEALQNDEKVLISGFGTFEVKKRAERVGRNPMTGEEYSIPSQKAVTYKASKVLKDIIK